MGIVVNADGAVLGRLATVLAKRLLEGETIVVINAEKAIITGEKAVIENRFYEKRERGDRIKGPFYPRYPDMILKRTVRGMLPHKKSRGETALKNLKVFMGDPDNLKAKSEKMKFKTIEDIESKYITIGNLSKSLGAKPRWE